MVSFLIRKQRNREQINLGNMIGNNPRKSLTKLIFKEAVVPDDLSLMERLEGGIKEGCSINPEDIPDVV